MGLESGFLSSAKIISLITPCLNTFSAEFNSYYEGAYCNVKSPFTLLKSERLGERTKYEFPIRFILCMLLLFGS